MKKRDAEVSVVAGVQGVLEVIESRRYKVPQVWREAYGTPTDGQLDKLIAALRDADNRGNYPLKVERDEYKGDNWLVSSIRFAPMSGFGNNHKGIPVYVTTDRVRCSEIRGDAEDDAECFVAVRNNLPTIIAALEELLERRLSPTTPLSGALALDE